ncbi:FecCD family ABC transporter permease [Jiella avicenniae]|uniref:Iron ABC transporter permease n=1 Tax=Jiella avicenniae TaxID=2907202 RepID=A0A9X1P4Q3_9HYPH|nr:iron ABC transporter permease [Jiella avicenniae]MCE7029226.1 iron ABC transporter permease [Jiella avicenniae]
MERGRASDGKPVLRFQGGLQIRLGNLVTATLLALAAIGLAGLAASIGTQATDAGDLVRAVLGGSLDAADAYALWTVRLPRVVIGFLAGWAVGLSGAVLQSLARNPLADPGLFGINQGSMVTIMLLLVFWPAAPREIVPLAALFGGLGVGLLLIRLVGAARSSGLAILLMGIAVETILSAVTSILVLYTPSETSYAVSDWLAGSLFQASWAAAANYAPWFAIGLVGTAILGRSLTSYELGDDMARAIGEPVARTRPLLLVFAVLMSATAVSAVGPLSFLGVLAPHLAAFASPATGRARLILAGLTGGCLVIASDCLIRGLPATVSLPIGLALTLIGVPLFMVTLRLRSLRRLRAP